MLMDTGCYHPNQRQRPRGQDHDRGGGGGPPGGGGGGGGAQQNHNAGNEAESDLQVYYIWATPSIKSLT